MLPVQHRAPISKEPRALALLSLRRPTPIKLPVGDIQEALRTLFASEHKIPHSEFEWQFLGLIAALRISMPSAHTAFDAFLYNRIPFFEKLEATKESLDHLDHSIASDSALLSRSSLAEFAANIPSLYIERAINAPECILPEILRKDTVSMGLEQRQAALASLETILTCFECTLRVRSQTLRLSTGRFREASAPFAPACPQTPACVHYSSSAFGALVAQHAGHSRDLARHTNCPLLRPPGPTPPTPPASTRESTPPTADALPPALSALVERSLVEWLALDELLSLLELPPAFATLSAKVPTSLLVQLERAFSNANYGGRRALALLHSDASALHRSFGLLLARRQPAPGDPRRALLTDLCTRCSRIAQSTCERLLARESRALVCTLFDARAFEWAESREFFEVRRLCTVFWQIQ